MSLSRICNPSDLLTAFSRTLPTANAFGEMQCTRYAAVHRGRMKNLHVTSVRRYPDAPPLPLPVNVSEIFANETGRFTPERARDIAAPVFLHNKSDCKSFFSEQPSKSTEISNRSEACGDTHVDSYDCFGAVSLNGTMQSNVPKPYCSKGKTTYMNMPGGQWARNGLASYVSTNILLQTIYRQSYIYSVGYSTNAPLQKKDPSNGTEKLRKLTFAEKKERFKRIVRDYGSTVIVFHITISLISLGACYAAVVSGLDLKPAVQFVLSEDSNQIEEILNQSTTFLLAYAIHKVLAPARIGITCGVTPLLVQRLRKMGILKTPKPKAK